MPANCLPLRVQTRPLAWIAAGVWLAAVLSGCQTLQRLGLGGADAAKPSAAPAAAHGAPLSEPLVPSPRLIVGRVVSVDPELRQAIVELAGDTPAEALLPEAELATRDAALRETGRLRVSRQIRGKILGTFFLAGSPAVNNEVVWLAP
jgi:hypothetical protein